jgi:hypothetical protein
VSFARHLITTRGSKVSRRFVYQWVYSQTILGTQDSRLIRRHALDPLTACETLPKSCACCSLGMKMKSLRYRELREARCWREGSVTCAMRFTASIGCQCLAAPPWPVCPRISVSSCSRARALAGITCTHTWPSLVQALLIACMLHAPCRTSHVVCLFVCPLRHFRASTSPSHVCGCLHVSVTYKHV